LVGGGTPTKEEVEKYLVETVTSTSEEKSQSMTTEISPLADSVEMTKIFLPNHIWRNNTAQLFACCSCATKGFYIQTTDSNNAQCPREGWQRKSFGESSR
jgi:hypothetical protein